MSVRPFAKFFQNAPCMGLLLLSAAAGVAAASSPDAVTPETFHPRRLKTIFMKSAIITTSSTIRIWRISVTVRVLVNLSAINAILSARNMPSNNIIEIRRIEKARREHQE